MFLIYLRALFVSPCKDLGHLNIGILNLMIILKYVKQSPINRQFVIYLAKDVNVHSHPCVFANSYWYTFRINSWGVEFLDLRNAHLKFLWILQCMTVCVSK